MNLKYGLSTMIGENQIGLPYPVFFDPHYSILNNNSPVTLITGSPGSGKTFCGLTLATHSSILGKITFILDPKGDFIALKNLEKLGYIENVKIWSVINSNGEVSEENIGILDPTCFYDNYADNSALTLDIIIGLIGEVTPRQKNALIPIIRDVVEEGEQASFGKVVQSLMRNKDDEVRSLGFGLDTLTQISLSKLLVKNKRFKRQPLQLDKGTVVASLMGLSLPPDNKQPKDYNTSERVSVSIMGLLMTLVLNILRTKPKKLYKTLIIDEAWAVMGTRSGRDMINQVSLLGRSLNMAGILLTQSPRHLEVDEDVKLDSTISARLAFRNKDKEDNKKTVKAMDLDIEEHWDELLFDLDTGVCLMQDSSKNIGIVHITVPEDWAKSFNTNPQTLGY